MVVLPGYLYMAIAYTTTMRALICQASCKHHFSLATWLAFAMASSCLELLASELHSFLCAIYIGQSNVSRWWCNFSVGASVSGSVGLVGRRCSLYCNLCLTSFGIVCNLIERLASFYHFSLCIFLSTQFILLQQRSQTFY